MILKRIDIMVFFILLFLFLNPSKVYEEKICFVHKLQRTIKQVALTFDDGPHPGYTTKIVDILKEYNVKATFFLVGKQVEKYPELVKYICENSDSKIANHTYSHKNLVSLSTEQIEEELLKTQNLLHSQVGRSDRILTYFRPPGGHFNTKVVSVAEKLGFKVAMWSVFTNDHTPNMTEEKLLSVIQTETKSNKEIILLHSGSDVTIKCLPKIINFLKENEYEFATVDEILSNNETYNVN